MKSRMYRTPGDMTRREVECFDIEYFLQPPKKLLTDFVISPVTLPHTHVCVCVCVFVCVWCTMRKALLNKAKIKETVNDMNLYE